MIEIIIQINKNYLKTNKYFCNVQKKQRDKHKRINNYIKISVMGKSIKGTRTDGKEIKECKTKPMKLGIK